MAEVFAIATAAASGLEQCIRLCERVQTAVERQKDLPQLIKKHSADISRTKAMVELVESEKALGTPNVRDAIERVVAVGDDLKKHLSKMASTKRRCFWGFLKQFISGQKYQDALDTIMRELGDSKNDLSMHIQLANVGLTRGVGEQVMVSVATVESVNRQLQEKLGSGHNLRIHNLLEGRPRNGDNTVRLTDNDIAFLSTEDSLSVERRSDLRNTQGSRIVRDNVATQHALQVNTPIGVDVWENVATVRIEGNQASGHAFQFNYPMSSTAFSAAMRAKSSSMALEER